MERERSIFRCGATTPIVQRLLLRPKVKEKNLSVFSRQSTLQLLAWPLSVLLKDTLTPRKEELWSKPPGLQLMENLLCHLKFNSLKCKKSDNRKRLCIERSVCHQQTSLIMSRMNYFDKRLSSGITTKWKLIFLSPSQTLSKKQNHFSKQTSAMITVLCSQMIAQWLQKTSLYLIIS